MINGEKSREKLNEYLTRQFTEKYSNRRNKQKLFTDLFERFNMTEDISDNIISQRRDIREFNNVELFCILYCIDETKVGDYYTKTEINSYSKYRFERETAQLPYTFTNMVKISDDQFIGRTSLQELMKLKRSSMINYDPNEQRALRRVVHGSTEIFKPWVSPRNVQEIRTAMQNGTYIPDPITLNMPEGSQFTYEYSEKDKAWNLTVEYLPNNMFNLDDGYHRYLGMSQIHDFDKDFDYPMELRVVAFDNAKANTFIFQQDQKTVMKKVMSDSYNAQAVSNRVVAAINSDPKCYIKGSIGTNC